MLNKLALSGIKSRLRDYVVLFSGLVIGSAIFYMFMALATNDQFQKANSTVSVTPIIFGFGAVLLAIITFVYIIYANSFLLSLRQRDYALFMMLGAKSRKISRLIFTETLALGVGATLVGTVIGVGLTAGVSQLLRQMLDAPARHLVSLYWPAVLTTIIFFTVLFFLAALVNARKMRRTPVLELLHADTQPVIVQRRPVRELLLAILGIISLGVGYWAMKAINHLGINSIPIALVTIVLGSFLLVGAVVTSIVGALRRNHKFAQKNVRSFTLAQIGFRLHSYTAILAVVSILFALALGAITVGLNFYQETPTMTNALSTYDVVLHDPTTATQREADKLTGVTSKVTYDVKVDQANNTAYFQADEVNAHPVLEVKANFTKRDVMQYSQYKADTAKENTVEYQNAFLTLTTMNIAGGSKLRFVDAQSYARAGGQAQKVVTYRVSDLRANIPVMKKIHEMEIKRYPQLMKRSAPDKYTMYTMMNGMNSGFAFMGFFLGLAFLAMLASTLMFKILSGAAADRARYRMLSRMGVRPKLLRNSIRTEIGVLFGVPAVLGVVHVLFGLQLFKALLINPYAGIWVPFAIFAVLYILYYVLTVWLYNGIVRPRE